MDAFERTVLAVTVKRHTWSITPGTKDVRAVTASTAPAARILKRSNNPVRGINAS